MEETLNFILNSPIVENGDAWEFWVPTLILCSIAYLIGSLNAGQLLSSITKKDIGETGSKSYGSTNVGRKYGYKGFFSVFFFDSGKSVIAGLLFWWLWMNVAFFSVASITLPLFFIMLGHVYPIFFKFKGGKGIASLLGCIALVSWINLIFTLFIFAIAIFIFNKISAGSFVIITWITIYALLIPITAEIATFEYLLLGNDLTIATNEFLNIGLMVSFISSTILIGLKHKSNYVKLVNGKELSNSKIINFKKKLHINLNVGS